MRPITTWRARQRHRRCGGAGGQVELVGVDGADLAELSGRLAAVEAEFGSERDAHVAIRLQPLVDRRVPVRVVEAVPSLHAARIRFADGTAVFVQGFVPGDVAVLARRVRERTVLPVACSTTIDGTQLSFRSSTRARDVRVRVTGVDQQS